MNSATQLGDDKRRGVFLGIELEWISSSIKYCVYVHDGFYSLDYFVNDCECLEIASLDGDGLELEYASVEETGLQLNSIQHDTNIVCPLPSKSSAAGNTGGPKADIINTANGGDGGGSMLGGDDSGGGSKIYNSPPPERDSPDSDVNLSLETDRDAFKKREHSPTDESAPSTPPIWDSEHHSHTHPHRNLKFKDKNHRNRRKRSRTASLCSPALDIIENELIQRLRNYADEHNYKFLAVGIGISPGDELCVSPVSGEVYVTHFKGPDAARKPEEWDGWPRKCQECAGGMTRERMRLPVRLWQELDILPFIIPTAGHTIDERGMSMIFCTPKLLMLSPFFAFLHMSHVFFKLFTSMSPTTHLDLSQLIITSILSCFVLDTACQAVRKMVQNLAPTFISNIPRNCVGYQHEVEVDCKSQIRLCDIDDYKNSTHPKVFTVFQELVDFSKARRLCASFFSSTSQGGGVAIMRHSLIRMFNLVDLDIHW
jgi:hypothetical protein